MKVFSFGLVLVTLVASACSQTVKDGGSGASPSPSPSPASHDFYAGKASIDADRSNVAQIRELAAEARSQALEEVAQARQQIQQVDGSGLVWLDLAATSQPTEKGSFLGAAVSEVPMVLRDQLKLQKGLGLVVNYVEKGSPAETAGLKQSDVLQKLDDQILVNAQQFAVLVRTHAANVPVKITLIREAKPTELTAKLEERDLQTVDDSAAMRYIRNLKQNPYNGQLFKGTKQFNLDSKDANHHFIISNDNGSKHLKAMDKSDKLIFEGPVDTDEQVQKLPGEIRSKVQDLLARKSWPMNVTLPRVPSVPSVPAAPATPGKAKGNDPSV